MTCIRTLGWNRTFELHRLMKKIHRSIMDKLFVVSVCVHTSNCSNPNKKQVKYKHSHYRNENWWNTFSLTVMDFSFLRRFVPSSITDKTFTGLWVIWSVSHNKQKLLTIREQLYPPPLPTRFLLGVVGGGATCRPSLCYLLCFIFILWSCAQCCLCLWIVYFWSILRFSLTFIYVRHR